MHVYSMYTSCKHASVLYRVIVASWCGSVDYSERIPP